MTIIDKFKKYYALIEKHSNSLNKATDRKKDKEKISELKALTPYFFGMLAITLFYFFQIEEGYIDRTDTIVVLVGLGIMAIDSTLFLLLLSNLDGVKNYQELIKKQDLKKTKKYKLIKEEIENHKAYFSEEDNLKLVYREKERLNEGEYLFLIKLFKELPEPSIEEKMEQRLKEEDTIENT